MKGLRQVKPRRVFETVSELLRNPIKVQSGPFNQRVRAKKPVWFDAVQKIPPSEITVRTLPPQHHTRNPKSRKASKLFQPMPLVYEEDALRTQFYKDHPWELARPRFIIESDGRDSHRTDWSRGLRQPDMPLCGESVVQRQMWMMDRNPEMTKEEVYDVVRKEFYALRHEEQVEKRIAVEEARAVGAYFGKSFLQIGIELESKEYESWKKWAGRVIEKNEAARNDSGITAYGEEPAEADEDADMDPMMGDQAQEGEQDAPERR